MLNKGEEPKLDYLIEIIITSKKEGKFPQLTAYDIEWLATKLKECNDELKEITKKYEKADQTLGNVYSSPDRACFTNAAGECVSEEPCMHTPKTSQVYKNPRNEISDRFYPRD